MTSPDGSTARQLTARKLLAFAFSKDGAEVYGILRSAAAEGGQWRLDAIDVKTDGKRFLTSIAKWPYDIWMLEGFDRPKETTWLAWLLRR